MDTTRTHGARATAQEHRQHERDTAAQRRLAALSFSAFVRNHNARVAEQER